MGISNFFKRKRTNGADFIPQFPSPTAVFNAMGPTLAHFWELMIRGQNCAVEIYHNFNLFKTQLDKQYSAIDYDRHLFDITTDHFGQPMSVKQGMYLYMINLDTDCFISFEDSDSMALLTCADYQLITSRLSSEEKSYCDRLVTYIDNEIFRFVREVDIKRYGIEMCSNVIPLNTLKLTRYHRFIATKEYDSEIYDVEKWRYIFNAPFIFESCKKINEKNPLVISETSAISAFVLDYICYSTMALPTIDITKLLAYTENGQSLKKMIADKYGQQTLDYILNAIEDLNGSLFRSSVYNGLLLR